VIAFGISIVGSADHKSDGLPYAEEQVWRLSGDLFYEGYRSGDLWWGTKDRPGGFYRPMRSSLR
jgi:hypothetical protein